MNLHGIAAPYINTVNPFIPVLVRVNTGVGPTQPNGSRQPLYATPGAFTGSITGTTLTISAIASGVPQVGQTIAGAGIPAGTAITRQLSGDPGAVGTYSLNRSLTFASGAITSLMSLQGQVQPMASRDLRQVEGLNLGGEMRKLYLYGEIDAVVRSFQKGGDLVTITAGVHRGTWLVNQTLEQFPDWVSCAITLQNGG